MSTISLRFVQMLTLDGKFPKKSAVFAVGSSELCGTLDKFLLKISSSHHEISKLQEANVLDAGFKMLDHAKLCRHVHVVVRVGSKFTSIHPNTNDPLGYLYQKGDDTLLLSFSLCDGITHVDYESSSEDGDDDDDSDMDDGRSLLTRKAKRKRVE